MYNKDKIKVPRFKESLGFYTTQSLSKHMSKIRGSNTRPEVKVAKALWRIGFRYRKNVKSLPGKPDLVFMKYNLVIFIDGDFWHGYNWEEKKKKIKSNRDYWIPKIERNIQRDKEHNELLKEKGFHVLRIWEHEVNKDFESCIKKILFELKSTISN